jgi:hypothetical protein
VPLLLNTTARMPALRAAATACWMYASLLPLVRPGRMSKIGALSGNGICRMNRPQGKHRQ